MIMLIGRHAALLLTLLSMLISKLGAQPNLVANRLGHERFSQRYLAKSEDIAVSVSENHFRNRKALLCGIFYGVVPGYAVIIPTKSPTNGNRSL